MPSRAKIASLVTVIALGGLAAVGVRLRQRSADPAAVQTQDDQPAPKMRTEVVRQTVHRRAKAERSPSGARLVERSPARALPRPPRAAAPATAAAARAVRDAGTTATTAATTLDDHGGDRGGDDDDDALRRPRRRPRRRRRLAATAAATTRGHGGGDDDDSGHGRGRGRGRGGDDALSGRRAGEVPALAGDGRRRGDVLRRAGVPRRPGARRPRPGARPGRARRGHAAPRVVVERRIIRRVVITHPAPSAAARVRAGSAPPRAAGPRPAPAPAPAPAAPAPAPAPAPLTTALLVTDRAVVVHELAFAAMGTHVRLLASDAAPLPAARAEVERLAAALTRFDPRSELCALNADPRRGRAGLGRPVRGRRAPRSTAPS